MLGSLVSSSAIRSYATYLTGLINESPELEVI